MDLPVCVLKVPLADNCHSRFYSLIEMFSEGHVRAHRTVRFVQATLEVTLHHLVEDLEVDADHIANCNLQYKTSFKIFILDIFEIASMCFDC